MKPISSSKIERYLGAEKCEELSRHMKGWYGPRIALMGVPGAVYLTPDGDFAGKFREGGELNFLDRAEMAARRLKRAARVASSPKRNILHAGFTSLSDLISEATVGGKKQELPYFKNGVTGVISASTSYWTSGGTPAAGAAGSAAPGGRALTSATTGALVFNNAASGDQLHFVSGNITSSILSQTLLVYDRLFDVAKTMNSTATEAVTGTPSRYQSTTAGAPDSAEGNFLFVEVGTALAATAHNWTVCTYTDQAGGASTLPSLVGNSAAIASRLDHPLGQWFAPLEAGDVGIKALTQMQCSAAVATGTINFVIGHPIAFLPAPIANLTCIVDGVNTAFNLERIFDNAALAFMQMPASSATATTYGGTITLVSG
jgi:hypothetical protein